MSPENVTTGDKPNLSSTGQGRWEQAGQQLAPAHRFGGVCVDSASGSSVKVNRENCGDGNPKSPPSAQTGSAREAAGVAAEVGVLHSSVDLHYLKRCKEPREDTCSMRRSEAKDAGIAGPNRPPTPDKVRSLQIALYRKAKASPTYRFWSLYGHLLRRDILETALQTQIENRGAAGVDGQTLAALAANAQTRTQWLGRLQEELKTKAYRPSPVRRVMIPKSGGGQRPLGIPTVKDRVAQTALGMILMPIFEADFHPHSFGFRPKRDAHQAIEAINSAVRRGHVENIDADLSKHFDTIPHRGLMKAVAKRISDGSVLRLIKQWLRAPVVEEDRDGRRRVVPNRCGTPQDGVISPLLANVYLNPLDWGVNQNTAGQARMIRYADDFVIACRVGRSRPVKERLRRWLSAKGLNINEVKTRVVNIHQEGINFLGFNLTWRGSWKGQGYLHVEPGQKSRRALREHLSQILNHWTLWRPVEEVVQETNAVLRGWAGYFHFRNSTRVFGQMRRYSQNRLRRWLWRKHDCTRGLWKHYSDARLRHHYGLYELPMTAAWKGHR